MASFNFENLVGRVFNRLTVISRVENNKYNQARWLCQCICGNQTIVSTYHLKSGRIKSCGCMLKEIIKNRSITHGCYNTRNYSIYNDIKKRCYNKNSKSYANYGGRGIKICDEWKDNYIAFRDWALANGYRDDLTIDRIDSNGNYCPENCRWIPKDEQARNKTTNIRTPDGKCLAEYCRDHNLPYATIYKRLLLGWSMEDALSKPLRNTK